MSPSAEQWNIGKLLETSAGYLGGKGSSSPRLDAELLLAETLGLERIELYTQFDRPLTKAEVAGYRESVARRASHEPVAYILGRAHFRRISLEVDPSVLIPRPETEELVEAALCLLSRRPPWEERAVGTSEGEPGSTGRPLVADIGTGSGAIALSLAHEAGLRVLATDKSAEALAVAARNVCTLGLEGMVELTQTDLLAGLPDDSLHLVVCNPPYVSTGDLDLLPPDIRLFEPLAALDGGPDGLAVIRRLLPDAARVLRPGGTLLLEVGDGQAAAVKELVRETGFATAGVQKDLSGKDRIVEASLPGVFSMPFGDLEEERQKTLAHALEAGGISGVPTDTVYGLAARWDSAAGVSALFAAKGRSEEQIVAVLFASVEDLARALPDLHDSALRVMEALLPGPYTFVVATEVSRVSLVGTDDSLGVRVPDHPALLELIGSVGIPLAATSANRTGERDAATLSDVDPAVLSHCTAAFSDLGTEGSPGEASTVVDLRPLADGAAPVVLREGAVSATQVLADIADLKL